MALKGDRKSIGVVVMFLLCLLMMVVANLYPAKANNTAKPVPAAAKLIEVSNNQDCAACHGGKQMLPKGHAETKSMDGKDCKTCHTRDKHSLWGKAPLSHLHLWNGKTCRECHPGGEPKKALTTEQCLSCHKSQEAVAKLTKDMGVNVHKSHMGSNECSQCHQAHGKSTLACGKCHDYDFKVP